MNEQPPRPGGPDAPRTRVDGGAPAPRLRRRHVVRFVVAGLAVAGVIGLFVFSSQLAAFRDRRRVGPDWSFPSVVYSDRVRLASGATLPRAYLDAHLEARGYRRVFGPAREPGTWSTLRGGEGREIFLRGFLEAHDPEGMGGPERIRIWNEGARVTRVERLGGARGGARPDSLHDPALEPVRIATLADSHRVLRRWVPLSRIPRVVGDAVIASEDRRFRSHHGVDAIGLGRALVTNVRARGVREGGSTLTQQLARGLWLGRERSVQRKLAEATLAVLLEAFLSKDQILEMYLNSVYWGSGDGVGFAGIAEAAEGYFGCAPEALKLEQAALLAAVIPAPNAYSPFRHPGVARARRNTVLDEMVRASRITAAAAAAAKKRPLGLHPGGAPRDLYPSYSDWVRETLARELGRNAVEGYGLTIFTPLDVVWQEIAQRDMPATLTSVEPWPRNERARLEGAFVALDPRTGRVRALLGGRAPGPGDFNRATRALRQPGSAAKPILYAAALEAQGGARFSPDSTMPDLQHPFHLSNAEWTPRNSEGEYHAKVSLAYALAHSLNIATIELTQRLGPENAVPVFERLGLGRPAAVLSVGLGTHEVTPLALTAAYAAFGAGGTWHEPTGVRAVVDGRGRPVRLRAPATRAAVTARTATLMRGMLECVTQFGTGYGVRGAAGDREIAGKTGTTNQSRDGWFVGFTPSLAAGMWVGYDAPRSLGGSASGNAMPAWAHLVGRMLDDFPRETFDVPPGYERVLIDAYSGGVARGDCPRRVIVMLPKISGRRPVCTRDHRSDWFRQWFGEAADSVASLMGDSGVNADSLSLFLAPPAPH